MANCRNTVMKWTVGVVTAPREKGYYLQKTLSSIKMAKFENVTVFAEPHSIVPEDYQVVHRPKKYGDWTNWAAGFYELLLSNPETDYFLMAEDDSIFCQDTKKYIEYAIPYLGNFGYLSLYTPSKFQCNKKCFHNELNGVHTWSTVAIVIKKEKAISFFSDCDVQRHRFEDIFGESKQFWMCSKTEINNSVKDAVLAKWCSKYNYPVYYHTPSLAEHIGEFSTLTDQESTKNNSRMSADFVGENADLTDWFKEKIIVKRHNRYSLF